MLIEIEIYSSLSGFYSWLIFIQFKLIQYLKITKWI